MPIMGGGNTDSLSMSGNTGQTQSSVLGQVPTKALAPTNYTNFMEMTAKIGGGETGYARRLLLARRELNAASEDPVAFGGIGSGNNVAATIGIRPSGASFPSVKAFAKSRVSENPQFSHPVVLPFGIESGDLLLTFFVYTFTLTNPSGWTTLFEAVGDTRLRCAYRIADGTESQTVAFTTSSSEVSTSMALRISGYQGTPEFATATGVGAEPPSLTPSWGANNTLWLALSAGNPMTDQAIINGPQGSIYGYYDWINRGVGANNFFYADQRLSPYKDRNYYTSASSPNALIFPNTSLSINDFYDTSPIDEWSLITGGGDGGK